MTPTLRFVSCGWYPRREKVTPTRTVELPAHGPVPGLRNPPMETDPDSDPDTDPEFREEHSFGWQKCRVSCC